MADQGLLGQSKPAGTTNTVLYSAPIDSSASTVLSIANDGSAADYDVAIKDYDQKLALDASTYKLHKGDIITGYRFEVNTAMTGSSGDFTPARLLLSDDGEKQVNFESFHIPAFTEIHVKKFAVRQVALESTTGTFVVGDNIVKGSGGNTATATVYAVVGSAVHVGPTTLAGSGAEFADGDAVTATGGATGTISTGGVGSANDEFVFSTTTAGGTYNMYLGVALSVFTDRTYRFNVADTTMSGLLFKLSDKANGEWGEDNTFGTADDNTEWTTGKTTSGTAGSGGTAYVQYDLSVAGVPTQLFVYEGTTGTAANANYGGSDRFLTPSTSYTYTGFWAYNKVGTWVNSTDSFTIGGTTYTVTGQTAGPYGYVRDYSGSDLFVIKGTGSADFAGSDTFYDVPKSNTANRTTATVSSVTIATSAVEASNYIVYGANNASNAVAKITALVIGAGERLIVESASQNNVFSLIGFEDTSTAITTRNFGAS